MVSAAPSTTRFVSFEIDADRTGATQQIFAGPHVEILEADAVELVEHGPFDQVVLDGGPGAGNSAGATPVEPRAVL